MGHAVNTLFLAAIVVAEVASAGLVAATPAAAQSATRDRQQIKRQQRLILQQQRQIEENQRLLASQQRQVAGQGAEGAVAVPQQVNRGIFGNIGNCPVGWSYDLFTGCLPAVHVIR